MARPTDSVTKFFRVKDAAGAPVSSLTAADFTFMAQTRPYGGTVAAFAHASTVVEISGGWYAWTYTVPSTAGYWFLDAAPVVTSRFIEWGLVDDELENQDLDSIYANTTSIQGVISGSAVLGNKIGIELIAFRARTVDLVITDSAGDAAPLDTYTNWRIGIRSVDQTTTRWTGQQNEPYGLTIAGSVDGSLTIHFPESLRGPLALTWAATTLKTKGDFVVPTANNGWIYQASGNGTTSGSQPIWPTTAGGTVVDGTVTWTARARLIWTATTVKAVGQVIRPTADIVATAPALFRCTVAGTSAGSEPTWSSAANPGDTLTDGTITWQRQSDPYTDLPAGTEKIDLRWEAAADAIGDTFETVSAIASSLCAITRREVGT